MSTDTLEHVEIAPVDTDDPIRSHVVNCPPDKESTQAWLTEARVFGMPVTALCGHVWVPSRDPKKHPVCEPCLDEVERIAHDVNSHG